MTLPEASSKHNIEHYWDGFLKDNLLLAKDAVQNKDFDMVIAVDGHERSGKSVIAMQCANFVDDEGLTLNKVVFTSQEFTQAVINAKKYSAIVYDEAFTGLSSRATMSLINRTLQKLLAEIGQKNLFIFVVMPSFFDLDKYVALWRSRALIHVYMGDGFQRGFFTFYNIDKKKDLYIIGKKFYNYRQIKPNFYGRFTNHYVIDEAEYRKKKGQALNKHSGDDSKLELKKELTNELLVKLQSIPRLTHELRAEILGLPLNTYYNHLKTWRELKTVGGED